MKELTSMPEYRQGPVIPLGPYSTSVRFGSLIFVSGQIPVDENKEVVEDTLGEQVKRALRQLYAAAGWPEEKVSCLSVRVYTTALDRAGELNQAYADFHSENGLPLPARELVGVAALPKGALVEIAGIFAIEKNREEE